MIELLQCPFCGFNEASENYDKANNEHYIGCCNLNCGCRIYNHSSRNPDGSEMHKQWNKRNAKLIDMRPFDSE
jgi:hypothetical protein